MLGDLSKAFGHAVSAPDMMAYFAAVGAHPAYTERFQPDLVQPGLRFPLTTDASLFDEAVELGREVVWLHCFGERFVDAAAGRPKGPPRMAADERPMIPQAGAISTNPKSYPDRISYDESACRLLVGSGFVENVPRAVWEYEVSGKHVLVQWFSYRRRDRSRPIIGTRRQPSPLDNVQLTGWLAEYTSELMNVLHVLGRLVALEARQAGLLGRICAGRLIGADELRATGALDAPRTGRRRRVDERQGSFHEDAGG